MIDVYDLNVLLSKYGLDANKVLEKNYTVIDKGNYKIINEVLDYLVNELNIDLKNIEKCPSILYFNVTAIRENYEFLMSKEFYRNDIVTCLHILNTNPMNLKETYNYVLKKYGIELIRKNMTILSKNIKRIKIIEDNFFDKVDKDLLIGLACTRYSVDVIQEIFNICSNDIDMTISVLKNKKEEIEKIINLIKKSNIDFAGCMFLRSSEEIEKILEICKKYNVNVLNSMFYREPNEVELIIRYCLKNKIDIVGCMFVKTYNEIRNITLSCKKNNISVVGSVFMSNCDNIEKIINICRENNIEITGSVFKKSANELINIIDICKQNDIRITGGIFHKTSEEISDIVNVCRMNNILVTGSVFHKSAEEIKKIIKVCKDNNIEVIGSVFLRTSDEIDKIIKLCKENNIRITGSIFYKKPNSISKSIEYIKNNYSCKYLTSLIVCKDYKYLEKVFPYLDSLRLLPIVINSSSILTWTLEEIMERKEYIECIGDALVVNGKFNSIFGLSRKNYNNLKIKKRTK